ncbi:MAG: MMPL family transporter, partial [Nocardia sp.]|nr:MMPL family transporter [Nocardia sp.]
VAEAGGAALTTAGRTITISGLIVLVTLSCLAVVNSPVFREITVGISATVVCLLIVALTALPALLGLLGPRVSRWSLPNWAIPADARLGSETPRGRWSAWARHVMARPVRYGVAAVAILAIGLIPLGSLRYGLNLGGDALAHTDSGRANTVLAQRFTPGLSGPIQVVVTVGGGAAADPGAVSRLTGRFATDNRVWAQLSQQAEGRQALVIVPAVAPDSAAAIDLVRDLRAAGADAGGIEASVGGPTAQFLDLVHETESKTAWVVGLVVALSLIFLGLAFRSVLLPIKAVIMNLLVTGAAVGLGIAVFQWGHGSSILHFTSVGYVQIYLPVTVFCVLFGLSMDYEVFLLGRIREEWERGDPALPASVRNEQAVAAGIEHTARPITAAAAIMVVILLSLLTADVLELKQFGLAIAAAIAADALLVRLVLVPAFMKLVGGANWWPGSRGVRAGTAPAPVESMVP